MLKKSGNFPTKHFVHYKLEKVNFLTYNDSNNITILWSKTPVNLKLFLNLFDI